MQRRIAAAILLALSATPFTAVAQSYVGCATVNRVAVEAGLGQYSNAQIENGLCMTSKEIMNFMVANDVIGQAICSEAATHMMREFQRRFPGRSSSDVIDRC